MATGSKQDLLYRRLGADNFSKLLDEAEVCIVASWHQGEARNGGIAKVWYEIFDNEVIKSHSHIIMKKKTALQENA